MHFCLVPPFGTPRSRGQPHGEPGASTTTRCPALLFPLMWHLMTKIQVSSASLMCPCRQGASPTPSATSTPVKFPFCPNFSLFPGAVTPLTAGDGAVPSRQPINIGTTALMATGRRRQMEPHSAATGQLQGMLCPHPHPCAQQGWREQHRSQKSEYLEFCSQQTCLCILLEAPSPWPCWGLGIPIQRAGAGSTACIPRVGFYWDQPHSK